MNSTLFDKQAPAFDIREGFEVRDLHDDTVGTVKTVRFSDDDPTTEQTESIQPALVADQQVSLLSNIADTLADRAEMPEEVRRHLLQKGYVRISRGLIHNDVFATMDQVSTVLDDVVHLNAGLDDLMSY